MKERAKVEAESAAELKLNIDFFLDFNVIKKNIVKLIITKSICMVLIYYSLKAKWAENMHSKNKLCLYVLMTNVSHFIFNLIKVIYAIKLLRLFLSVEFFFRFSILFNTNFI